MASQLRAVFVVPTDPAILRNWSIPIWQLSPKKRTWDFRSSAYKIILWQWKTPHPSLSQNLPRNCLQIFGTFLWNSPGNLIWPNIGPQQLLAEMLQFDGLGFLFQCANLKIHTDGTNVTLLEGAKAWIPGRWGEMASKSLGKKPKGGKAVKGRSCERYRVVYWHVLNCWYNFVVWHWWFEESLLSTNTFSFILGSTFNICSVRAAFVNLIVATDTFDF